MEHLKNFVVGFSIILGFSCLATWVSSAFVPDSTWGHWFGGTGIALLLLVLSYYGGRAVREIRQLNREINKYDRRFKNEDGTWL
jgi:membrane protein implicated in regulation of membrane protease activity